MTKIRRLFLAGTAALFALSATLEAQEAAPDRAAAAKKLFASMDMANLLQASMAEGLEPQMAQFKQMGMSDPGVTELKAEMLAFLTETMKWETLEPEFVRIYATAFTAGEMQEMIDFYKTPTGKKAIAMTPKLMSEGMMIGQKAVEERQAELQARITPIIEKHLKPQ
jgi:uncharacterized protein